MYRIIISFFLFLISISLKSQVSSDLKKTASVDNDSLISRINRANDDSSKIELYALMIGKSLMTDPTIAQQYLYQSQQLMNRSVSIDQDIRNKVLWLIFCNKTGRLDSSKIMIDQIAPNVAKVIRPRIKISFLMEWAGYFQRSGRYGDAGDKYEEVRQLAHELKMYDIEYAALTNFASMLGLQKNTLKRKEILLQVVELATEKNFIVESYAAKLNLAETEMLLDNYGEAENYLKSCLDYFVQTNNLIGIAIANRHFGQIRLMTSKYEDALTYFRKSLHIRRQLNDKASIARLCIRLAETFHKLDQSDSAKKYIKSSVNLSDSLGLIEDLKESTLLQAEILASANKFSDAYKVLKKHVTLSDSSRDAIDPVKLGKQTDIIIKNYTDSTILTKDKQLRSASQSRNILAILFGASTLSLLWFLTRRKKSKTPSQISDDKGMVTSEIEKIQQQIILLNEKESSALKAQLLNVDNRTEAYWSEFNLYFSRIYPDFFSRLRSTYPDLNQSEIKICMLMKLNLGIQELSDVLSISIDGVRKARYRIYKKMNLNGDPEFADHILKF